MMTSSNGNTLRVTGHLFGEFTGHRWISLTKPVTRSCDGWVNNRDAGDLRRHRPPYDATVMIAGWQNCTTVRVFPKVKSRVKGKAMVSIWIYNLTHALNIFKKWFPCKMQWDLWNFATNESILIQVETWWCQAPILTNIAGIFLYY